MLQRHTDVAIGTSVSLIRTITVGWDSNPSCLAAIATVLMYFEFPIPFMPPFLKVDLSGAVVLIGAFIFGIAPAITMIGIKDIIHLTQTQTGGSGEVADYQTRSLYTAGGDFHSALKQN